MAKNIDFKGLLNTVPYFLCEGMCWNCGENKWVDSGKNDNQTNIDD